MRAFGATAQALRKVRPNVRITRLLQTALAPSEHARQAWADWQALGPLDDASWAEVRLLASLPPRLSTLDPQYEFMGRLNGFRRYIFAHNQRTLASTRPMLWALHRAGIEMLLLKGAARLSHDPSAAPTRFIGDIDILVRERDWEAAVQVAKQDEWAPLLPTDAPPDRSPAELFAFAHGIDFVSDVGKGTGRLDVHHHARHMCRFVGDDAPLWSHASSGEFLGVPVLLPAVTDQMLIMLSHALRHGREVPAGDWALDVAGMLDDGAVDWRRLTRDAITSNTQAFIGSALLFLRDTLELEVPLRVTDELIAAVTEPHLGELNYLHRAHYGSLRRPDLALKARDVAILRATRAARGERALLTAATTPKWPVADLTHVSGTPIYARIAVPSGLRSTNRPRLDIRLTLGPGRARIGVVAMRMVLEAWVRPGDRVARTGETVRIIARPSAALLLMGRATMLELRIHGDAKPTKIRVVWRPEPLVARLRRVAKRVWRRLRRALAAS